MIKKYLLIITYLIFCAAILALSIRGIAGNPNSEIINNNEWKDEGPLELSPERGRFALTYSIVEDKSVYFSLPIARFVTPDLGYSNGKYVSLFFPGLSFLVIPGYIIGKIFGISQVGTFAVVGFFALLNVLLIVTIARRLGTSIMAAILGSLVFIFATPAFAYSVSLYQHHISTFLILSSLYILLSSTFFWALGIVWLLVAASIPVDYPNLILMLPIGLYGLGRMIYLKTTEDKIKIGLKLPLFLTFCTAIIPLALFLGFNQLSYGNPFQISGTVPTVKAIDEEGNPTTPASAGTEIIEKFENPELQSKSLLHFFQSRKMLNGFYIHFLSPDRGILYFTPVILFAAYAILPLYKKNSRVLALLLSIIGMGILLYSMWGDPWGGWAFGSRYLIPTYALFSILLAVALDLIKKNILLILFFFAILAYSISVNSLGALTSNRNPPQVEILALEQLSGIEEKYTYERNYDFLYSNRSKSYIYQTYLADNLYAWEYYRLLTFSILAVAGLLVILLSTKRFNNEQL